MPKKSHAEMVVEVTVNTKTVSVEALRSFERSPFQPRESDDAGKFALARDIGQRGLDNALVIGTTPDGVVIAQGHRRIAAILFAVVVGWIDGTYAVPVTVREYKSRMCDALRDDTLDHGQSIGLANNWELYQAVKPLLTLGEDSYGDIVYKLKEAFDHNCTRVPETESLIRGFERTAEVCAREGDTDASDAAMKAAVQKQAEYRRGALQTIASTFQLSTELGHPEVEDYMKRVWLGQLQPNEKVLSHGPLIALKKAIKEGNFDEVWEAKTTRSAGSTVRPLSKAKINKAMESTHTIVRAVLWAVVNGREDGLAAIAADLESANVGAELPTFESISK